MDGVKAVGDHAGAFDENLYGKKQDEHHRHTQKSVMDIHEGADAKQEGNATHDDDAVGLPEAVHQLMVQMGFICLIDGKMMNSASDNG